VVTREENYYALAENGLLVFIDRAIGELPTDGRPISQTVSLAKIYARRLPLYQGWCDIQIKNDTDSVTAVVNSLLHIMGEGGIDHV